MNRKIDCRSNLQAFQRGDECCATFGKRAAEKIDGEARLNDGTTVESRSKDDSKQALSWIELCISWINEDNHDSKFEEDLQKFVDTTAISPIALKILFEFFDKLQAYQAHYKLSNHLIFCMEAIRASLCVIVGQKNDHASQWVEIFFEHELAYGMEGETVEPKISALTISEKRAQKTIEFRAVWNTLVRKIKKSINFKDVNQRRKYIELLQKIATKAGHPELIALIVQEGFNIHPNNVSIDNIIEKLQSIHDEFGITESLLALSQPIARFLVQQNRVEDLIRFAEAILQMKGNSYENQAEVEAWLGKHLKDLRQPQRFIDRIGISPRSWEYQLTVETKVSLWTERSNALRILRRLEEALDIAQQVAQLVSDSSNKKNKCIAQLNVAILLRETGAPDAALKILNDINSKTREEDENKISILNSLATTFAVLGENNSALQQLEEALRLATGPRAIYFSRLQALKASLLASMKRYQEVLQVIQELSTEQDKADLFVNLSVMATWATIIANERSIASEEAVMQAYDKLLNIIETAKAREDIQVYLDAITLQARIIDIISREFDKDYQFVCNFIYREYERYEHPQNPVILLLLARFAYQEGKAEEAREYLVKVPVAISSQVGSVTDVGLAVNATRTIIPYLNKLTNLVILCLNENLADWKDIRLISELHRDVIARGKVLRQRGFTSFGDLVFNGEFTDVIINQLAPEQGNLAVIEWIDDGQKIACFCTRISATGEVSSYWLNRPEIPLSLLAKTMRQELNFWSPIKEDPFDLPEWKILEKWLISELSPFLLEDDHIIFIEHEDYLGLPWHVAAAQKWTSSYISSWTSLLMAVNQRTPKRLDTIGLLCVPRFNESLKNINAFNASVERTRELTESNGLNLIAPESENCDQRTFQSIMAEVEIVKFIGHGFFDNIYEEVALLVSYNKLLPLANSTATKSSSGQHHVLSWRDCQYWTKTPLIIFSGACLSGITKIAGIGERLGLYNAFVHKGTKSFIAPRGTAHTSSVFPILDDVIKRYTVEKQGLAKALREACRFAEEQNKIPRLQAWLLVIEGDWK